jgi:hypothetical protein
MELWLGMSSYETAIAGHTPGTPYSMTGTQVITNLAAGGPTISKPNDAHLAYYFTANWVQDTNDYTVAMPNGHPFCGCNNGDDAQLPNQPWFELSLSALTTRGTEYSGIAIFHFVKNENLTKFYLRNDADARHEYMTVTRNENNKIRDSDADQTLASSVASGLAEQWTIMTWTHNAAAGSYVTYNGRRPTRGSSASTIDNTLAFDKIFNGSIGGFVWTDVIVYTAAHSLAALDVIAMEFAEKYDITYVPPA